MPDPYLTLERVVALNPCHSAEKIQAWYPGRKRVRLSTVLKDDRITRADRLWVAVRVLPREVLARWLTVVVERAIRRVVGRSGCPAWEEWAASWLSGADRTETAAWAAWAAWAARAWATAEAEAEATAEATAAAAAAWAARAWATAEAEAAAAAVDAEREQQIADLLEIMKTDKETNHA